MDEWRKWKNCTDCAFDGSGGTAYHLVKQFEVEKDGHAAWGAVVDWYNGNVMKSEMADAICPKLENYWLGNSDSAS
eukprot:10219811-Ditylum_brightwellii.AAC.1